MNSSHIAIAVVGSFPVVVAQLVAAGMDIVQADALAHRLRDNQEQTTPKDADVAAPSVHQTPRKELK